MRKLCRHYVLIFGLSSVLSVRAICQDKIAVPDFNVDGALPTYDLADIPLGVTLLNIAALQFRDVAMKTALTNGLNDLTPKIVEALDKYPAGYLVRCNLFLNEGGTAVVPGGEFLTPIGVGLEPADSLAEFYQPDRLAIPQPTNLRSQSVYIWIERKKGKLVATSIANDYRKRLEQTAVAEARRRRLLAEWFRFYPGGNAPSIQRADFWIDAYERLRDHIADQDKRKQIEGLNAEAAQAQKNINALYKRYYDVLTAISENQTALSILEKLPALISIVDNGIKAGTLLSSSGEPLSSSARPTDPISDVTVFRRIEETNMQGLRVRTETNISMSMEQFKKLDQKLQDTWKGAGVPPPSPEVIPPP